MTVTNKEFCDVIRELMHRWNEGMTWYLDRGMTEAEAAELVGQKFTETFFPELQTVRQTTTMNTEGGK
jgi:hypothetical protein